MLFITYIMLFNSYACYLLHTLCYLTVTYVIYYIHYVIQQLCMLFITYIMLFISYVCYLSVIYEIIKLRQTSQMCKIKHQITTKNIKNKFQVKYSYN
jgi:hypothetical protein